MAVPPTTNEEFIREVDDELRREQALTIWKQYGRWMIGVVLGGLALCGAYLWWQNDRETKRGIEGEQLSGALDDLAAGKTDAAKSQLDKLVNAKSSGVAVSAKLATAALALSKDDSKSATSAYGAIAADTTLDQPYRDLALVRQTAAEFDTITPQDVVARLKPLAAPGNPWFGSAGEMVGIAYLKMGKNDLAAAMLGAVAKDNGVPESIRERVIQLAGNSGADAAPLESTKAK